METKNLINSSTKFVWSFWALLLGIASLIYYKLQTNVNYTLTWDVFGYYIYLPVKFIQEPSGIPFPEWIDGIMKQYNPSSTLYQMYPSETGLWMTRYSIGMAILYSPFFFIAHFISPVLGYAQDGFTFPYQATIAWGTLLYAFVGLIYLRKVLLYFFDEKLSAIVIVLLVFGTNYLQMTAEGSTMTHIPAFTLVSLIIWFSIQWNENQNLKYTLILAALIGFIGIIRPSEVIVILIPIFWGVNSRETFFTRIQWFIKHWKYLIYAGLLGLFIASPQFYYWYRKTGHFLYNSYGNNAGEGLDFFNPHIIDFLFSFRKGWFVYTPLLLFATIGLYQLYRYNRSVFWSVLLYYIIGIWVLASWTVWWYAGGSYSSRAALPLWAALSIPLGYCIQAIRKLNSIYIGILGFIIVVIVSLNLFQNYQFWHGIISKEHMTYEYYCRIFGKTTVSAEDQKLLLQNLDADEEGMKSYKKYHQKLIHLNHSSKPEGYDLKQIEFSQGLDTAYGEITDKSYIWVEAKINVFIPQDSKLPFPLLVVCMTHKDFAYKYRTFSIPEKQIKYNDWNTIKALYLTPNIRSKKDHLKVYMWNQSKAHYLIKDLTIHTFEVESDE